MTEDELLEVAERLESSMDNLAAEVARQDAYGHRNRTMIWGLVALTILTIALGVVSVGASLQAREATSQSNRNAENAKITCEAGNESRRLQNQLWTYVLDQSEQNPELTAFQKKQIAAFRGKLATTYAPRDCNNVPTIPSGTVTPTVSPTR